LLSVPASAGAVAVIAAVAGAGTAAVFVTTEGETSQGLRATTHIERFASTIYLSVGYKARCGRSRSTYRSTFVWKDKDGEDVGFKRGGDTWEARRVTRRRIGSTRTARIIGTASGVQGSGDEGTFRITVRILNRATGRTVFCRTGKQTFETERVDS